MISVSAPGKVILFGERAIVYNRLAVSCAIDLRTHVQVKKAKIGTLYSSKYRKLWKYNKRLLIRTVEKYWKILDNKNYDKLRNYKIYEPLFYLTGKIFEDIGYKNLTISIKSEIPKGTGSSSSLACAVTFGVYKLFGYGITMDKLKELSINYDSIAHGGTPSGNDIASSAHGGFIAFRKNEGVKELKVKHRFPILIIDTGTPSRSLTTANHVRHLMKNNFKKTSEILDDIERISNSSIDYLAQGDGEKVGKLMFKNQELLRKLGISTKKIDNLIGYLKNKHRVYGAKITGGGGGGSVISIADNYGKIMADLNAKGFKTYLVATGVGGVREEPLHSMKVSQ